MNFHFFKLVLEKAEEPEINLPASVGLLKSQENSRKTCASALLTSPKPLTVWITANYGKLLTKWEYQTTWPDSWENCMQVKKLQWEKARVGCSERTALEEVCYHRWNRSPAQVGCMRQVLSASALGRLRGMGWGRRREGGSGWGTHVNPWWIHLNVWQKPLQYCKVISLQLIKINGKKIMWEKKKKSNS